MAMCGLCGGLGRVAAGGITARFAGMFGAQVRECGLCHGTGLSCATGRTLPRPRAATPVSDLRATLPGEWLVEIHGSGRILSVMRFLLTRDGAAGRFEARCDFGGPTSWSATGEWTSLEPGDSLWFTGRQSSPYLPAAEYQWGAALQLLGRDVLHGASISNEWTMWSRTGDPADPTVDTGLSAELGATSAPAH